MSIILFNKKQDYGTDYYIQFLNVRRTSLLQFSVSWNDYPSWPYIQISSGNGRLFSFMFWVYKFGVDVDILSPTWNFKYLDEV